MEIRVYYACPHCGWQFPASRQVNGLVPRHVLQAQEQRVEGLTVKIVHVDGSRICPGFGQVSRSIHDKRPLWKDMPAGPSPRPTGDTSPAAASDAGQKSSR